MIERIARRIPEFLSRHKYDGLAWIRTYVGCPVLLISNATVFGIVSMIYHCACCQPRWCQLGIPCWHPLLTGHLPAVSKRLVYWTSLEILSTVSCIEATIFVNHPKDAVNRELFLWRHHRSYNKASHSLAGYYEPNGVFLLRHSWSWCQRNQVFGFI